MFSLIEYQTLLMTISSKKNSFKIGILLLKKLIKLKATLAQIY